jgi:hypothetical protein
LAGYLQPWGFRFGGLGCFGKAGFGGLGAFAGISSAGVRGFGACFRIVIYISFVLRLIRRCWVCA